MSILSGAIDIIKEVLGNSGEAGHLNDCISCHESLEHLSIDLNDFISLELLE